MRIPAALIAVASLGLIFTVQAQERRESSSPAVYKVEFDLRDSSDGEAKPSQHFSMVIDESRKGVFHAGSRVPAEVTSPPYVDVGVNIECTVQEADGKAALQGVQGVPLQGVIELISIVGYVNLGTIAQPIIGQRKLAFNTTVNLGTPAVIISDRNSSAGTPAKPATLQVEATVTKMH